MKKPRLLLSIKMSVNSKPIWYFLSKFPAIIVAINIIVLTLIFSLQIVQEQSLFILIAFALSELTMIVAAAGGVAGLLDPDKSGRVKRWMVINTLIFFSSALAGVMFFMQL